MAKRGGGNKNSDSAFARNTLLYVHMEEKGAEYCKGGDKVAQSHSTNFLFFPIDPPRKISS